VRSPLLLALAAVVFAPAIAHADENQLFSATPRPMSLAGAYTALASDASALYYNPAGLTEVDGSYIELAFLLSVPNLSATKSDGTRPDLSAPSDFGYGIHLAWSPRTILDGNLGLGFSVLLPDRKALHFVVHRFDDPYFVLYENAIELLEIRLGAAYKFFDLFSIGVSGLLLAGLNGKVTLDAPFQASDMVDQTMRTVVSVDALLPNREFFTAGIQFFPLKNLRFGLSYREPTYVRIQLPIDFTVEILGLMPLRTVANLDVKVKYAPAQLTLGGAWDVTPDLLVTADLGYAFYSKYEIPYGNLTLDPRFSPQGITLLPPRQPITDLRDVIVPRVGVEYRLRNDLSIRGGYYFLRSFIKSSDAPIFDSDKHGFTAGATYGLGQLFLPQGTELNLLAAGQVVFFAGGTTAGYAHAGQVFSTTFGAEFGY
jgi:long-chain fatty acid transport protein